ncbi:hypothetical protein RHGRI_018430 [Rhododendron griersonianum]|uniref:RING-type E3 ubiquitin transferase n=1 Tax=Rhododendron griersonianum TaxID=479676 RepID=A0AAV6K1H1_9ERIC|nr:hypothetical protein RHGRI_018430 [Rhododendron griersonianum]
MCLEELREGETSRVLVTCGHSFYPECIRLWLMRNPTCPICRTQVDWFDLKILFLLEHSFIYIYIYIYKIYYLPPNRTQIKVLVT